MTDRSHVPWPDPHRYRWVWPMRAARRLFIVEHRGDRPIATRELRHAMPSDEYRAAAVAAG